MRYGFSYISKDKKSVLIRHAQRRAKALVWLRSELAAVRARLTQPYRRFSPRPLRLWQYDSELAGSRKSKVLDELPRDERIAWNEFWDDVRTAIEEIDEINSKVK